jgi:hypothetical protein
MAIVSTVAKTHTAASSVTTSVGFVKLPSRSMTNGTHLKDGQAIEPVPQNLKLIILRITSTPMIIQHALNSSRKFPERVANSGMM